MSQGPATINLFKHQQDVINFISKTGGGAIYHEMGLGKTRSALELYKHFRAQHHDLLKLFVVCPISLIESAWGEDIRKFTNFTYRNLHKESYKPGYDIYLLNFEGIISKSKRGLPEKIALDNPTMCVVDESSKIKNFKALTTKKLLSLRKYFQHRIVMSGTPAPNCDTEYWPQLQFAGNIFPESFYAFRNKYFCLQRNGKFMTGKIYSRASARDIFRQGWKYVAIPSIKPHLMQQIATVAHFAKKRDCLDLPEQIDEVRKVEMSPAQRTAYKQMQQECMTFINNTPVVAQVALTKLMKLRQITSSFAISTSNIADENCVEIPGCPKTKELLDVLEDAGNQQAIIWCNFHYEIERLATLLGEKAVTLYGGTKDKESSIIKFKNGDAQYLIAHPKSAAYGLTFVNCSLQIFFSLDYSFESHEQARSRTHRAGQVNKCTYVYLLCEDSIDETILAVLQKKGAAEEIVYEWIRRNFSKTKLSNI